MNTKSFDFFFTDRYSIISMKDARNTILESAKELFAQKGYSASSIREISQAAGVTKPVIYYHFHKLHPLDVLHDHKEVSCR